MAKNTPYKIMNKNCQCNITHMIYCHIYCHMIYGPYNMAHIRPINIWPFSKQYGLNFFEWGYYKKVRMLLKLRKLSYNMTI